MQGVPFQGHQTSLLQGKRQQQLPQQQQQQQQQQPFFSHPDSSLGEGGEWTAQGKYEHEQQWHWQQQYHHELQQQAWKGQQAYQEQQLLNDQFRHAHGEQYGAPLNVTHFSNLDARPSGANSVPVWRQLFDAKTGAMYYFNKLSGATQWEEPAVFEPVHLVALPVAPVCDDAQQQSQELERQKAPSAKEIRRSVSGTSIASTSSNWSEDQIDQPPRNKQGRSHRQRRFTLGKSKSMDSYDSADEANTSDEDDGRLSFNSASNSNDRSTFAGEDVRWWGRPGRSRTIEDLDDHVEGEGETTQPQAGRFRTISSIDQQSIHNLAALVSEEKEKRFLRGRSSTGSSAGSLLGSSRGVLDESSPSNSSRNSRECQRQSASASSVDSTTASSKSFPVRSRARANTTSAITREDSADTDASEELACVSGVIHAHMVQFRLNGLSPAQKRPRFRVFDDDYVPAPKRGKKGKEKISPTNDQTQKQPALLQRIGTGVSGAVASPPNRLVRSNSKISGASLRQGTLPTRLTIQNFMQDVFVKGQMEKECLIMSFAYLERLLKSTKGTLVLGPNNWKAIVLSTMILASKMYDDMSMWNVDFSLICPSFTLQRINELEVCLLEAIQYQVRITPSVFAKYHFQLRAMRTALGIPIAGKDDNGMPYRNGKRELVKHHSLSASRPASMTLFGSQELSRGLGGDLPARRRCNTLYS